MKDIKMQDRWYILSWRNFGWLVRGPFETLDLAKEEQYRDYGTIVQEVDNDALKSA